MLPVLIQPMFHGTPILAPPTLLFLVPINASAKSATAEISLVCYEQKCSSISTIKPLAEALVPVLKKLLSRFPCQVTSAKLKQS